MIHQILWYPLCARTRQQHTEKTLNYQVIHPDEKLMIIFFPCTILGQDCDPCLFSILVVSSGFFDLVFLGPNTSDPPSSWPCHLSAHPPELGEKMSSIDWGNTLKDMMIR